MEKAKTRYRSRSTSASSRKSGDSRHRSPDYRRNRDRNASNDDGDRYRKGGHDTKSPPQTKCLGVFGLSANTSEDKIYEIFSKFGKIKRINVIFDTKTGRSRGFCFVYFKHLSDAVDAKKSCSGMEIDNRRIRVDFSITNRPHEPTPGVYKGRRTSRDRSRRRSRSRSRSRS
uniref:TRA-2 n=1 Tax=Mayetiola destructor TaxID=39758 RepID=U3R732_MAYDE|nr:TRA-2 [Mayetiola destructor]